MNAILSIKPQFVKEIMAGRKKYEFRKKVFKQQVNKVYVYASSPVCRIIGEFVLGDILEGDPDYIWSCTKSSSGITREYFKEYYGERRIAFALEIKSFKSYERPINPYIVLNNFTAPQSFCYLENSIY